MTFIGWIQIVLYCLILLLLTKPLGVYMTRVMEGEKTLLEPLLKPLEHFIYRFSGIKPEEEMHWSTYAYALLAFSLVGALFTYVILRLQGILPFNPMGFSTAA